MDLETARANKAIPPLRQSDLYTNITDPTRYEKSLAAPSDEELMAYWWAWASVSVIAGLVVLVVFLSVLSSRSARKQPFNLYLLYLMIPDFTLNFLCAITCLLNVSKGSYWSHWMCNFQHWYVVFGISANCWLNAVITYQLHQLLKANHTGKKFKMPSNRTVTMQSLAVYIFCGFLGTWGLFDSQPNFSYGAIQVKGLTCSPAEVDGSSSLFFWLVYMPLISIIPTLYIAYVSIDIWWRKLLPPAGKRRLLAVYYGRIVMVFLVLWGPYFVISYALSTWVPALVFCVGGIIGHLQSLISAAVSMLKPDIYVAVKQFVTCQVCCGDTGDGAEKLSGWNQASRFFRTTSVKNVRLFGSTRKFGLNEQPRQQEQYTEIPFVSVWPNEDGEYTSGDEELEEEGKREEQETGSDHSGIADVEGHDDQEEAVRVQEYAT